MVIRLLQVRPAPADRTWAVFFLVVGMISYHVLDVLLLNAAGYASSVWWPLTEDSLAAGMLYRSSDR